MKMKDIFILLSVLLYYGLSGADTGRVSVSVKEGDSFIVNTGVITNQQEIRLYFNNDRIARITRNLSYICTDVQCKYSDERFRGRLKVDHQTGTLTIMNTTTEDSGLYKLWSSTNNKETFSVVVQGVSSAERDEMKRKSVKEGESVTLDPAVINNPNDVMTWHFNGIVISEITGNQSKICTDVQCEERFRDRLKLDHQTGSLTITNTRNTDSGEYKLKITSSSSILRRRRSISVTSVTSFRVTVIAAPDSGPPRGAIGGIVAVIAVIAVLLLVAAVARRKGSRGQHSNQRNDDEDPTSNQNDLLMMKTPNAMSHSPTEASNDT